MSTPKNASSRARTPTPKGKLVSKHGSSSKSHKSSTIKLLTTDVLEDHGITYDPNIRDINCSILPDHVKRVGELLLSLDGFLEKEIIDEIFSESSEAIRNIPESAYFSDNSLKGVGASERQMLQEFIGMAKTVTERAVNLRVESAPEDKWQDLFKATFFEQLVWPFSDRRLEFKVDDLRQIVCVSTSRVPWYGAQKKRGLEGQVVPKAPMPDAYLGFRIQDTSLHQIHKTRNDKPISNFTDTIIGGLMEHNLYATATSAFGDGFSKLKYIPHKDLLCFPWAVIELKGSEARNSDRKIVEMYCQASNGASSALCILENVAKFAEEQKDNQHVPPVVTITSAGSESKVWLAYSRLTSEEETRNHTMICIWEGSLCNNWDTLQLCRIMENISCWASKVLRPEISGYIDQWRLRVLVDQVREELESIHIHSSSKISLLDLLDDLKNAVAFEIQNTSLPREEDAADTSNGSDAPSTLVYQDSKSTESMQSIRDFPKFGTGESGRNLNFSDVQSGPSLIIPLQDSGYASGSSGTVGRTANKEDYFGNHCQMDISPPDNSSSELEDPRIIAQTGDTKNLSMDDVSEARMVSACTSKPLISDGVEKLDNTDVTISISNSLGAMCICKPSTDTEQGTIDAITSVPGSDLVSDLPSHSPTMPGLGQDRIERLLDTNIQHQLDINSASPAPLHMPGAWKI